MWIGEGEGERGRGRGERGGMVTLSLLPARIEPRRSLSSCPLFVSVTRVMFVCFSDCRCQKGFRRVPRAGIGADSGWSMEERKDRLTVCTLFDFVMITISLLTNYVYKMKSKFIFDASG